MTSTIYLDTASKVARAALTGTSLPSVSAKLLSHLKLVIKCFEGDDIVTVDEDTMTCVIKPKNAPAGAPALIDTSAVFTGSGETAQYGFEWASADSVALRAHLDAAADPTQPQELRCEIEYELEGKPERVAFPIYFETSYTRPEDPAPEANADTSWEWLKAKILAGDNLTRTVNEDTKVITFSVPEFADGREIELQAGVTHLQWRYVGEVSWTNLVALTAITGPAGEDSTVPGPQGEDGREIELQAGVTHLQWRYVGEASWTDLIALSAITGPAGADGADALPVASQAEAEAGTVNDKSMTPLRTAQAIAALAGAGGGADVQVFFADGTWTNPSPAVARRYEAHVISAGGGGGSGRLGSSTSAGGGGAGGSGARAILVGLTTDLGATEVVVVGAGGLGGAAQTTDNTNGNPGANGGDSSFAGWVTPGGIGSAGGSTANVTGGTALLGANTAPNSATNTVTAGTGATTNGSSPGTTLNFMLGAPGSGGGGAGKTAGVDRTGGTGASVYTSAISGNAPGGAGGVGAAGGAGAQSTRSLCGSGGGGGGSEPGGAGNAGAPGGAGGLGGGGGGGGGGAAAVASGAGGSGGAGVVMIIVY